MMSGSNENAVIGQEMFLGIDRFTRRPVGGRRVLPVAGRTRFVDYINLETEEHYHIPADNPYVKEAFAFIKEEGGDSFVIGYIKVNHGYRTPEDPTLLLNSSIDAKVNRLAGFNDGDARRILYHAETPEQALTILKELYKGKGYSINNHCVGFFPVNKPIPKELEEIANCTIRQYQKASSGK